MKNDISILVNSTDSFEDCWGPFFTLFNVFWNHCDQKIFLNTETKSYHHLGMNIYSTLTAQKRLKITWSESLLTALNNIENEIILYLQDDYFLNGPVEQKKIYQFVHLMQEKSINCIHLTPFATTGPFQKSSYPKLLKLHKKANYKISLQAALWRKSSLIKYLRKHENPWQFEIYGSKRAQRVDEEFYMIDFSNDESHLVIPYTPTGIIKGRWNRDAVFDLFKTFGINIDFSKRGFYQPQRSTKRQYNFFKIIERIKSW